MDHPQLFHETIEDAIREVVNALGGPKKVAVALWTDRPPEAAHRLLLACLNEDRPERLAPHHLLTLMSAGREFGCHALMRFLAAETGYSCTPLDPADQVEKMQQQFTDSVRMLAQLAGQIEKMSPKVKR